jgi:hypothetical protein
MLRSVHYGFSQSFECSPRKAFEWCTDYGPEYMALMQNEKATRKIHKISDDVILLRDTFNVEGKTIVKQKLVCLYPNRLTWTSTHLTGPNKHSQFLYEIVPQLHRNAPRTQHQRSLRRRNRTTRQKTEEDGFGNLEATRQGNGERTSEKLQHILSVIPHEKLLKTHNNL